MAQQIKNMSTMQETQIQFLGQGGSLGGGHGNPLQYSCLENPVDRGAWRTIVQGISKSERRLSVTENKWEFKSLRLEIFTRHTVKCSTNTCQLSE